MFASQNLTAGQLNAIVKQLGGEESALRFLRGELVVSEAVEKKLLEMVMTVKMAGVTSFVAAEKFRLGKTIDGIKVGYLGDNFKYHFSTKVESEVMAEELAVNKLLKNSRDPAIITALGGEEKVEVSLGQFWVFLKTADQDSWYVAYIRDTDNVLWAVNARWGSDGLRVEAYSLDDPLGWDAGRRFLSR